MGQMSKRSAASAHLDGLNTAPTTPTTVKEHRPEDEVKTPDPIQHWLASVKNTMTLVKNLKFDELKFPPLPERQAVTDYLNALRLTDEQVLKYEELCQQAPETLRSRVDKTHQDFEQHNRHYQNTADTGFKVDREFTQAYKNTANIWPWLVKRATDIRWDAGSEVLAFIFYTLFQVCGVSAVAHMALWERVLVSNSTYKIYNVWAPQVAVSQVFFSAIFSHDLWDDDTDYSAQVYTYLASVVTHNTHSKNKVDVDFANHSVRNSIFTHNNDQDYFVRMTRPVQANEIILEQLVQVINKELTEETC